MKTLAAALIFLIVMIFSFNVQAEQTKQEKSMHEIHSMMRLMDNALCQALEGANLMMFGQMSGMEGIDRDLIDRGTVMVNDGKAVILKTLAGSKMKAVHKEGEYNEKVMRDLHSLGDRMLHVIEEVEALHSEALKQVEVK